jgi:hypothetical protein
VSSNEQNPLRTQLSIKLEQEIAKRNLTFKDVGIALGPVGEYFRRMTNGPDYAVPGDPLLRMMCQYFGWDYEETHAMVVQDRMRRKFGKDGFTAQGINPEAAPFHLSWPFLTKKQKEALLQQLQQSLVSNRKNATPVEPSSSSKPKLVPRAQSKKS